MGEYYQKGFGLKAGVKQKLLQDFYYNDVVQHIKDHDFRLACGGIALHMAREMGFCYGVERTIQYAYETIARFPDGRIYITDEIIHNQHVNEKLINLGMQFLNGRFRCGKTLDDLEPSDIVILPAFGVTVGDLQKLRERGCILVDTTCGSVLNVWKNVERYAREGITAIVHGKYHHEETRATVSQAMKYPGGKHVVVRDMPEAHLVADYIRRGGDAAAFLQRFEKAVSPGFDPDRDLSRIGLANQTTMLCSESLEIEKVLRQAILDRYGAADLAQHFAAFDTICTATQYRQDAVLEMLRSVRVDLMLVVGGFNSSNTSHLAKMACHHVPTYHIEDEKGLVSRREIRHRSPDSGEVVTSSEWLPDGEVSVGITAGASTPNNIVGQVIVRLFEIRGITLEDWIAQSREGLGGGGAHGERCGPGD